ncbi:MAG: prepilin-type N-terminal cleavage/methylation domain-containing protein [Planctomycetota bacterium]
MSFDTKARIARAKSTRRGLTLIELIVVLVILVGLGGLLVPTISNALSRTHVSTCATTFPEVHQMMQRVLIETFDLGDSFDSAIDTGAAGAGVNGQSVLTLNADDVAALAAAGITNVVDHDATAADFNITFNIGATPRALAVGGELITLTPAQAAQIYLPSAATDRYVWLGIGRSWTRLGDLAPEPPTHFGDTNGVLPDQAYSRFGIILQVADVDGPFEVAEFKRVSYSLDGTNFETGDNHIEVYWEDVQ